MKYLFKCTSSIILVAYLLAVFSTEASPLQENDLTACNLVPIGNQKKMSEVTHVFIGEILEVWPPQWSGHGPNIQGVKYRILEILLPVKAIDEIDARIRAGNDVFILHNYPNLSGGGDDSKLPEKIFPPGAQMIVWAMDWGEIVGITDHKIKALQKNPENEAKAKLWIQCQKKIWRKSGNSDETE